MDAEHERDGDEVRASAAPSREQLAEWARRGVRRLSLPLHGARAEVHDWVAREDGAFAATTRALSAARGHGMTVTVRSTLERSNARVLVELPSLLRARGVRAWRVELPVYADDAELVGRAPRLALALPAALAALDRARRAGLEVAIVGAPRCLLGPMDAIAAPCAPRAFAPRCDGCALRAGCPGVDAAYLARFGAGELRPR